MNRILRLLAVAGAVAGSAFGTATARADQIGPDWVSTDNVKFIKQIPQAADGVGGRVIGHYLYVTSSKDFEIWDISDPVNPVEVSNLQIAVEWENEMMPTNGKILGLSSSGIAPFAGPPGCQMASPADQAAHPDQNCLAIYDVSDKANPSLLSIVFGAGDHTSTCILDCSFIWGSSGHVTDLRHIQDPGHPARIVGNWLTGLPGKSSHNVTEVAPGYILTATQPAMFLSVRPEDGGDPIHPKLLATGSNIDGRFIHSTLWPRGGTDRFALMGGETNFTPQCSLANTGAFMTWDATGVYKNGVYVPGSQFHMIDQFQMTNGTYLNGQPPANAAGCSVHWFQQHPSFHDGGLVAVAAYDSGCRFMQVDAAGKIHEVGWFKAAQAWCSAAHWAPDGKTVYFIDYTRGIDVVQWLGPTYVPDSATQAATSPTPSASPGTGGRAPLPGTSAQAALSPLWLPLAAALTGLGRLRRKRSR